MVPHWGFDHDEVELVRIAATGRGDAHRAYEELVRRYQGWLVRLLTQLLDGRQAEAEDLAQETFVRGYLALPELGEGVAWRAWLRVVATRLAYNANRNRATRRRLLEDRPTGPESVPPPALAERQVLDRALGGLSYPYREILILRHVEELPLEEIATLLDIGLSAAKMRLKRAREAFVALYDAQHEEPTSPGEEASTHESTEEV